MHRHAHMILAGAVVLLAVSACEDPSTPPAGTPAEVSVRAYVDADGSGDFTTADTPITAATVTLTPTEGGGAHTATTGADGLAEFQGVAPGSYVATLSGDVPEGAVVSGPEQPVVVVPYQGGSVEAEFRYAFEPGTLFGVVFRDDDESGDYTEGTDETAPGAEIIAYAGTDMDAEPVATTVSGADGSFTLSPLRPGTYSVVVRVPEPLEPVGDTVHVVEVPAAGAADLWPQFTGQLLVSIADARAAGDGAAVVVQGVVLADQGTYDFNNRDTYIQDPTGGIRLWGLDAGLGLLAGDSVEVSGTVDVFNGELQLTVSDIHVLGTGVIPAARRVTGEEINSFTYAGQLGVTGPVTVVEVRGFDFDAHNVTVTDAAGTEFVIRVESPNEIPTDYWQVGEVYRVRGVLSRFHDTGQIKPRGFQDVAEEGTIGAARLAADDEAVQVEGVVLADQGTYDFQSRDTYIQDATGGVRLWGLAGDLGLQAGDSVRVTGTMDTFNEERQVTVTEVTVLGTGTIPDPRPVTGAEVNSFFYDGQLAITGPVTVVEVTGFSFDAHNVTVRDAEGTEFVIRVDSPNEITTDYWQVGESYRVTGVLARFRTDGQIKPRGYADVEEL